MEEGNNRRRGTETNSESDIFPAYLIEVTVSHQLVLMLQSVLEQSPYYGLKLRVGGQQIGAEHLQPCIGQTVHYRETKPED